MYDLTAICLDYTAWEKRRMAFEEGTTGSHAYHIIRQAKTYSEGDTKHVTLFAHSKRLLLNALSEFLHNETEAVNELTDDDAVSIFGMEIETIPDELGSAFK